MKETVNEYHFRRAFETLRPDSFSYAGLGALFEYLEICEEEGGKEIELDVIALCYDFTEYDSLAEFQGDYGTDYETIEDIEDETIVIPVNSEGFIIQAF